MIIIGLFGNPTSGKTEAARHLENRHGFVCAELKTPRMIEFEEILRHLATIGRQPNSRGAVIDCIHCDAQAEDVRIAGGQIWFVVRPERNRPTVPGIAQYGRDRGVLNDGTLEQLRGRVDLLLQQLETAIS